MRRFTGAVVRDYSERLGISLNSYGLIEDYAMAPAASEYTNREEVGAEPVAWYPFRVDKYEANTTGSQAAAADGRRSRLSGKK